MVERIAGGHALVVAVIGLLLVVIGPGRVEAMGTEGVEGQLRATARGFLQRIPEEVLFSRLRTQTLSSTISAEQLSAQLHLIGRIEARPVPELGLRLGLDTGLVEVVAVRGESRILADGRALEERFPETLFLGETYVELELGSSGWVELRLGKMRPRLGGGALFDAYGLGLYADLDLGLIDPELPYSFRLYALLPDATFTSRSKQSPFVEVEAAVRVERGTEIRLLGAVLRDGDDGAVPVLRDAALRGSLASLDSTREQVVAELRPALQPAAERAFDRLSAGLSRAAATQPITDLSSDGWLGWAGLVFTLRRPRVDLEVVGLLGYGELAITSRVNVDASADLLLDLLADPVIGRFAERILDDLDRRGRVALLSGFAQATLRVGIFEEVDLQGFLIGMTGDTGLEPDADGGGRYDAFVGLAPLITHTSLFFDGGVSQSVASPTLASPAPDGAGLLAGGLFVDAYPNDWLHVRSGLALMASTVASAATQGQLHGLEGNLLVDTLIGDDWLVYLDLAGFVPLSYYGNLDPGLQAILGVTTLVEDW